MGFRTGTLVAATALVSLMAGAVAAQETPKQGGTLVTMLGQAPRNLNPAVQSGIVTGFPGTQLFAAPLRYDEDWTPQPYLAESWEVAEDGLSVTLNLVQNAKFHDGTPITSSDVAFSVKTIQENHPFKTMFAPVTEVETPDDHTAILRLSQPHPALMLAMSSQLMAIIPEHIYGDGQDPKAHDRNSDNVVGSGPFKLVEYKRGEHVIVERFDDYFIEGLPYLDRIVMRIITDPAARAIALENGEVDLATFESLPRIINRLKEVDGLTATPQGYGAIGPIDWLAFNTAEGPTSNVKVRQAIAYAVDRNFILNALMLGTASEARTGVHPDSPFYEPDVETYEVDLDKANALLDEAGFPVGDNGTRFGLTVDFGWPGVKPQVEYLKAALRKVGIDVTVRASADFPTWAKRVGGHEFDMTWDTVFNWGDPVIGVHRTYQSSNIKKGVIWSNTQQYANARVDELLEMAGKESDPAKRKALYSEFQKIVADELPVYWTNTLPYHTIYSDRVGNPPLGIWSSSSPLDKTYLK
ncbi:MAG: ABC transporter substrate-binding protein [Rhodobacteraceae bacterium]|nr:ABC transporter substrate-binding protein [Paracoccaceae bacterium]